MAVSTGLVGRIRKSTLLTTNLAFSEWPKVFGGDEKLTTALLDRLAEHATVIATRGRSFRMRRRQKGQPTSETPTAAPTANPQLVSLPPDPPQGSQGTGAEDPHRDPLPSTRRG